MRVLLVTHRYPPDGIGGVERYVERLAGELLAVGDEVTIVTRSPRRWPRRPTLHRQRNVARIVGAGVRLEQFLVGAERVEHILDDLLASLRPEVVHVNHLIGISPRVVTLAQRHGAAVAWTLHDFYAPCPLVHLVNRSSELCAGPLEGERCAATCFRTDGTDVARWLLRYRYFSTLLGSVERVLCPSERLAHWAMLMQPRAHVDVLPIGVDRPAGSFNASTEEEVVGADKRPLRITYLGSVTPHKGLGLLADAVARTHAAIEVSVAGRADDPAFRRELDRRAGGRIRWLGSFAPEDRVRILGETDVVVVPSQVPEAFPLVPREALAHGVPVIGTRIGGVEDAIEDNVNGLLVDRSDPADLAAALRRLANDRELLGHLRRGAEDTPVSSFADHVDELRSTYAEICAGPRVTFEQQSLLDDVHAQARAAGFARR